MALIACAACGGKMSDAASACVHCGEPRGQTISCPECGSTRSKGKPKVCADCGHPVSRPNRLKHVLPLLLIGGVSIALVLFAYKITLPPPKSDDTGVAGTPIVRPSTPQNQVSKMPKDLLEKELRSYVIRINRLTPFKPNQSITLQRVLYDSRPQRLIYEYEMNVVAEDFDFYDSAFLERLQHRYCTSEELELASSNGVPVTWRYFTAGVMRHEVTIEKC